MTFEVLSLGSILICVTFFFAGIVDAVCGGGGLLTLPVFMSVGMPVNLVTGTNQCSTLLGNLTSIIRFAKKGHVHWKSAICTIPFTIIGSYLGSRLNMSLPTAYLERIMIVLLPVVTVIVLLNRNFGSQNHIDETSVLRRIISYLFIGLVIGMYQGFYGAGSGTFFMLGFAVLLRLDLKGASGTTKAVGLVSNITSAITYAVSGHVFWQIVLPATLLNIAGHYLGSELAMRDGSKIIRPMFLGILVLLFIRLVFSLIG